jgi:hypothetical protein
MARSLIQERMSIDRQRLAGWLMTVGGSIGVALGLVTMLTNHTNWAGIAFVVWVPIGVAQLVRARKRRVSFENEHGYEAGRQKPIT